MKRLERRLLLVLLGSILACGDSGSAPSEPSPADTDTSAPLSDADDVTASSDGDEEVASEDTSEPSWSAPPVAPEEAPVPLVIDEWMVASMDFSQDTLGDALDSGTFTYPEVGASQGAYWYLIKPDENGGISLPGTGLLYYAVANVNVANDSVVIVRADGFLSLRANGAHQPADVYHSGRHRMPLSLQAGDNLIVLRGYRRGNVPQVEIWTTGHEVLFNPADRTVPDLEWKAPSSQWVGLPVLNLGWTPLVDVRARVIESDVLEETLINVISIPPTSTTQVPFSLQPKEALPTDGTPIEATLRIESPSLQWSYETVVEIPTREQSEGGVVRRTFRSRMDNSVQYYGVREPPSMEPGAQASLVLSLHGAGVQAKGQAQAYSSREGVYVAAATNRRPFGFDWEAFGRLDGLEVLEDAIATLPIDEERLYVTGHSMGGHGTWQFGSLFADRFAVVGPSAGWISFATYGGSPFPSGPFGWASLSSDTPRYAGNLANRAVYIIHGTADDNVPIQQAYTMMDILEPIVSDLQFHEEPGAGHWWDGDAAPGADCVDWPPLFELMGERKRDLVELDFEFTSPSPAVTDKYSYVRLRSHISPEEPGTVTSSVDGDAVTLTTSNVRSLILDGAALASRGIQTVSVDGSAYDVSDSDIEVGPQDGKRPDAYGPLIQAFQQPFCLVWAAGSPPQYREYAGFLASTWNVIGNGSSCALPLTLVTDEIRASHNLIYLGVPMDQVPMPESMPLEWDELNITVNGQSFVAAGLSAIFPDGDRLGAVITTTRTHEYLLYRIQPFSSRFWIPDWLVFGGSGGVAAGFFDGNWAFSTELSFL